MLVLHESDSRIQEIVTAFDKLLANKANTVQKCTFSNEFVDIDEYVIWSSNGTQICRITGCDVSFDDGNITVVLPNSVIKKLHEKCAKCCAAADASYDILLKRLGNFYTKSR